MKKLNEIVDGVLDKKYQKQFEAEYDEVIRKHEALEKKAGNLMDEVSKELLLDRMRRFCKSGEILTISKEECYKEYWKRARTKYVKETKGLERSITRLWYKMLKIGKDNIGDIKELSDAVSLIITELLVNNAMPYSLTEKILLFQKWEEIA